jgi:hypothetical protein
VSDPVGITPREGRIVLRHRPVPSSRICRCLKPCIGRVMRFHRVILLDRLFKYLHRRITILAVESHRAEMKRSLAVSLGDRLLPCCWTFICASQNAICRHFYREISCGSNMVFGRPQRFCRTSPPPCVSKRQHQRPRIRAYANPRYLTRNGCGGS